MNYELFCQVRWRSFKTAPEIPKANITKVEVGSGTARMLT